MSYIFSNTALIEFVTYDILSSLTHSIDGKIYVFDSVITATISRVILQVDIGDSVNG